MVGLGSTEPVKVEIKGQAHTNLVGSIGIGNRNGYRYGFN